MPCTCARACGRDVFGNSNGHCNSSGDINGGGRNGGSFSGRHCYSCAALGPAIPKGASEQVGYHALALGYGKQTRFSFRFHPIPFCASSAPTSFVCRRLPVSLLTLSAPLPPSFSLGANRTQTLQQGLSKLGGACYALDKASSRRVNACVSWARPLLMQ